MKKTVSVLLSALMLFTCIPFFAFATEPSVGASLVNCALSGSAIGPSTETSEYSKATDGDEDTYYPLSSNEDFVGFDLSKKKNGEISSVSVVISLPEAEGGDEATYTVQYFRNNRWYDLFTFRDSDAAPDGYASYDDAVSSASEVKATYTKDLDAPLITQRLRIKTNSSMSVAPEIYELCAYGRILDNVAVKGKAYASSFKHFDWTPPTSCNDGFDFEEDWRGWEPQYPTPAEGQNTSQGFFGEYWGVEFTNREYYEISELVFYMGLHNSYAEPAMGYQNTKYKVEALFEGEWIVIAEFSDSDALPRDYDDYNDAMANDKSAHHIAAFYTIILDEPINTNNIRVTVNEFAKNYYGVERLVFPYIYEMRAYGVPGEAPDVELPEGAEYSNDATSLGFPYASSSAHNKYPLLAVDDDNTTGWTPSEKTANQTFGVKLDKVYTINDVYVQFADASFSAPFTIEALVDGAWTEIAVGNVSDANNSDKSHVYLVSDVTTDEIRIVFTEALTSVPEIREMSANLISTLITYASGNEKVEATLNSASKYNGVSLGKDRKLTGITLCFDNSIEIKYYIQVNTGGVWQTLHTVESVAEGEVSYELEALANAVRITYSNENLAPDVSFMEVRVLEDSGDTPCNMTYSFHKSTDTVALRIDLGKNQSADKLVMGMDSDYSVVGTDKDGNEVLSIDGSASDKDHTFDTVSVRYLTVSVSSAYVPEINELKLNIIGMKTYFLEGRFSSKQATSAASGNISIMGTPYANSNYPGMSYERFISDGEKSDKSSVWVPKLEEFSMGMEITCGIKLYKKYTVNKIAVYSVDVGNPAGIGSKFEIQALVDGEYVKISDGYTCADDGTFMTVYEFDEVTTDDIRLVFKNHGIHFPTVMELEIYSDSEVPSPFAGHTAGWDAPEVTVFKSEVPRFEVAGLPK